MVSSSSPFQILDRQRAVLKIILCKGRGNHSVTSQAWKILVYDSYSQSIVNTLFSSSELRSFGVTLSARIDASRGPVPDVPALYLISASSENVSQLIRDLSKRSPLYHCCSVAFLTAVSPSLLESMATQLPVPSPVSSIYDLHSRFLSLEQNLFSLNLNHSYSQMVQSGREESAMNPFVNMIVDGLFSVLVTLGVIPLIRAQRNGIAQAVALTLNAKIRDNIDIFQRTSLSSKAFAFRRPLLLLLDRSLDFNSILYHSWTYQALVHDCLEMKLNKVSINISSSDDNKLNEDKTYDLDKRTDSFWRSNASSPFPVVAESVEGALNEYRENVERINKRAVGTSEPPARTKVSVDTSHLVQAISSLPELSRKKDLINKHTNIATTLLGNINSRSLDTFFELESQLMSELQRPLSLQSPDAYKAAITKLLRGNIDEEVYEQRKQGSAADRLRVFLIYYDVFGDRFSAGDMDEYKSMLKAAGADVSIINYVAKVKGNQHDVVAPASPCNGKINTATLTRLMNRMVHRGYRSITNVAQSAKKLVTEQSASFAVARILEIFTKESARARDESFTSEILDGFILLDPKVMQSADAEALESSTLKSGTGNNASQRKMRHMFFSDAIVFVVGGGNYVEYENCMDTTAKGSSHSGRNVLYGTTEMVTAESFLSQLKEVSRKSRAPERDKNGIIEA